MDLALIFGFPLATIWVLIWHRTVAQDGVSAPEALALIVVVCGIFLLLYVAARLAQRSRAL